MQPIAAAHGLLTKCRTKNYQNAANASADHNALTMQELINGGRASECAVLDGRQQVHQPVVVKVVVQVIRVPGRHVALGELGDDRHFPDEVSGK